MQKKNTGRLKQRRFVSARNRAEFGSLEKGPKELGITPPLYNTRGAADFEKESKVSRRNQEQKAR